jgi:hypothetical protein
MNTGKINDLVGKLNGDPSEPMPDLKQVSTEMQGIATDDDSNATPMKNATDINKIAFAVHILAHALDIITAQVEKHDAMCKKMMPQSEEPMEEEVPEETTPEESAEEETIPPTETEI